MKWKVVPDTPGTRSKYTVTGLDGGKQFEIKRGYNDFYCLHSKLQERWPGIVLPIMPPKVQHLASYAIIVDEKMFYEFHIERHYLLQRLLRGLSKLDFIVDSEEFELFIQAKDDIDVGA